MAEPERSEQAIRARLQAARRIHRRLAARLGDIAGDIADTEDSVAKQLTLRAGHAPERADQLRAHAEKERREQSRWRRISDGLDQPGEGPERS